MRSTPHAGKDWCAARNALGRADRRHLIVGSCQIRAPFLETQDRALVVAYARRVYPGAKILERD